LTSGLKGLEGLQTPVIRDGCTHVYYIYPLILDPQVTGVDRARIHAALMAEGMQGLAQGYQNVHLLPMFQQKIAYGRSGFPWTAPFSRQDVSYAKGICPVAEHLHDKAYLGIAICTFTFTDEEVDSVIAAFRKVWSQLPELREMDPTSVVAH